MKVEFQSINEAEIKKVHDEIEGKEDKKHVVLSMPMEMYVPMKDIDGLYGCHEGQSVTDHYWMRDEEDNYSPRFKNVSDTQLKGVHGNGVVIIGTTTYSNCRATKARFIPEVGSQAKLFVTISIVVKEEDSHAILKLKGCHLPVKFTGDVALFEEEPAPKDKSQTSIFDETVTPENIEEALSDAEEAELGEALVEEDLVEA